MRLYNSKSDKLSSFTKMLRSSDASVYTIKNYVADIKPFLIWRKKNNEYLPDKEILDLYALDISEKFSTATIKRKKSAIKKYLAYEFDDYRATSIYSPALLFGGLIIVSLFSIYTSNNSQIENPKNDANVKSVDLVTTNSVPNDSALSKSESVYSFDNSDGVRIILSKEPPEHKTQRDLIFLTDVQAEASIQNVQAVSGISLVSQGTSTISSGNTEVVIVNNLIGEDSFITLVPNSPSDNQILYISALKDGYAIINIEESIDNDLNFSWKIDNTEVYHSIL